MGGGGGSAWACHVDERKQERERGGPRHGGRQRGVKDVADNGPRPLGAGGSAVAQTGESGGARATQRCTTVVSLNALTGIDRQHESWEARSLYLSALQLARVLRLEFVGRAT
jgi:hypothetical protein